MTEPTIDHSCSYHCDRPECIKAQRDELREHLKRIDAQSVSVEPEIIYIGIVGPTVIQGNAKGGNATWCNFPVNADDKAYVAKADYETMQSALKRAQEERDSLRQQMQDIEAEVERQIDHANERAEKAEADRNALHQEWEKHFGKVAFGEVLARIEKAEALAEQCKTIAHDWGQGVTDAETAIRALHKLFPIDGGRAE